MDQVTITDWAGLRAFALGLGLPGVTEATSWGQPCLKAHGKLWTWWSPSEDAPVFKVSFADREILCEAAPDVFFFTDHYRNHPLVMVRPGALEPAWVKANLVSVWRAQAPKRLLKAYDAGPDTSAREGAGSPRPEGSAD